MRMALRLAAPAHERGVDKAAPPIVPFGIQRRGHGLKGVERRRHVVDNGIDPVGNAVMALVVHHEAGKCLQHGIHGRLAAQGTSLAKTGNGEIDQAGIKRHQAFMAKAPGGR